MANATQYLEENYPSSIRASITDLDLSNKNFVGDLTISGFVNLQKLNYSFNNFNGSINVVNFSNIQELDSSSINNARDHVYANMNKLQRNTKFSKGQVTFPNSSVFDCQKNILLPPGIQPTNNPETPPPNDNLGLKIGLSVGIISAY
ncbi:2698_t:CDS:2 [Diversispora eburnea]|uniref:2698_t:CDS:1 n=1 Tax=Diversispora eburnea TaxID=1213867 RepID=A0A9N8VFW3_9GLOM|nr:2698_t:CDS:2 [Diversispora eburnea]